MTTQLTRKEQKAADYELATEILDDLSGHFRRHGGVLLITQETGTGLTDYLRVTTVTRDNFVIPLTWAIAQVCGYSLRDRGGRHCLAISGYGFSKSYDVALALGGYYAGGYDGVTALPYELI